MIIDFRIIQSPMQPLDIDGETVEIINTYKYLGFTIDNKLNWHAHIDLLCKKLNQRLFFLRKLKSFYVNENILKLFHQAFIQSAITFGISCWGGNITEGDRNRINRCIRKAGKLVGCEIESLNNLYEKYAKTKAITIANDPSHPLWNSFHSSGRSGRFITIHVNKIR